MTRLAAALLLGFVVGLVAMLVVIDRLFGGSGPTLTFGRAS